MSDTESKGERIAKVMARAGIASRRDAEKMILEGRVTVNGKKVDSPALDVLPSDRVTLDGKPIDAPQPARLWLYYKPVGLVTSAKDEKGRQTVFDTMPEGMPRVMSVGRLDLTSEGLLLLTNDGDMKRKLELPSTGWLRKYRVRVNGRPNEATFDPLRRGVQIEGEDFQPMEITLDKQQGANAWLTVGLREGKNREIRRAMTEVGLIVNRLIRVSYGPFRLNKMKPGDVVEVKQKTLREQLGEPHAEGGEDKPARKPRQGGAAKAERRDRPEGDRKPAFGAKKSFGKRPEGDARPERGGKPFERKEGFAKRPPRDAADAHDPAGRSTAPRGKPRGAAAQTDKPRWAVAKPGAGEDRPRPHRARPEEGGKPGGGKRFGAKPERAGEDRPKPYRARSEEGGAGKPAAGRPERSAKSYGAKPGGAARPPKDRPFGDKPARGPRAAGDDAPRKFDKPAPRGKGGAGGKPGAGPKDRPARTGPARAGGPEGGKPRGPRKGPGSKG
jgi:23S rRNA pseudouridine2605 synthase